LPATLLSALLRAIDVEQGGFISSKRLIIALWYLSNSIHAVDGVDISSISKKKLRDNLTIIPQGWYRKFFKMG
jgi:ABC-type multidrug transport system fused ATPase/permease subunit